MNQERWFAVYTRPRWEKKVADQLKRKKIECYCPQNRTSNRWSDRVRNVSEPLFSSYVFVYLKEEEREAAMQVNGVVNFVYWLDKPVVVKDEEIEAIKRFLFEYSNVKVERVGVSQLENVKIIDGPVITRKGNVLEVKNTTVKAFLPSLGQVLLADVRGNAETVSTYSDETVLYV